MPTSFKPTLNPKRKSAVRLVTKVGNELQAALIARKRQGKFTQADLARILETDRSVVNRYFNGYSNLTLNTIGELAWALDHDVDVKLTPKAPSKGQNEHPQLATARSHPTATTRKLTHIGGGISLTLQADDA